MQQLLYRSEAKSRLPSDEIFRIVATSSRNNSARGITGFLVYAQDQFLQLIEGDAVALDLLLADLRDDCRHSGLQILSRVEIAERSFPNWRMERIAIGSSDIDSLIDRLQANGIGTKVCEEVRSFFALAKAA